MVEPLCGLIKVICMEKKGIRQRKNEFLRGFTISFLNTVITLTSPIRNMNRKKMSIKTIVENANRK